MFGTSTGGQTGSNRVVSLRVGDRVRSHFQNRYGEKSAVTDVGTLLQFTTVEVEVHFDDGAVQCVSKTWIAERILPWDHDLAPGDLAHSHYASGKGRTQGTDLGIVSAVLDGGRARIRFQDDVTQTIPMGWVEQVVRLQAGDRVMSFFKVNDGTAAKSLKTDVGSVLQVGLDDIQVVFDDNVEQNVLKTWVVQRTRLWDLTVEIGDVADVYFEVGEDGRRSALPDIGIVVGSLNEGRIAVQFQDGVRQTVPLGWVELLREWGAGDRVQCYFKTGGGEKSNDPDVATILTTSLLEAEVYFDDGIQQCVTKAWVTERVRNWSLEVSDLAVGDVVVAHFKRPGNHCRSVQTDQGIVLSILPKGQVSIMFQDDVTQVIPMGWVESVATRWSGQREQMTQDDRAASGQENAAAPGGRGSRPPAPVQPSQVLECVICMDAKPNGVIVHGDTCHQSTCYPCSKKLQRNGESCPICREPIETVCRHHGD
eukprot:TRINITY_DN34645_c0_g1_i2.p1 TRINITY_DN34645_c0_g1~~TRINITY_DN34645_c0_g1_i2.p1  ORF type:complete len:481 (-),score=87.92 TRINITY_DN34645_c0_g1_i2:76-1518(-)